MSEPRSKDAQNLLPPLLACENVLIPGDLLEIPVNADHKTMGKGLCRGAPRRPGVLLKGSVQLLQVGTSDAGKARRGRKTAFLFIYFVLFCKDLCC